MAEGLVKFFLQRLDSLSQQESQILSCVEEQLLLIKSKLVEIAGIFEHVVINIEKNDPFIHHSIQNLREVVHKINDCIDEFIIMMEKENGSDQTVLVAHFKSELGKMEARLGELVNKLVKGEELYCALFKFKYSNLPYYLQACLMYCCIFPETHQRSKGRLVRLLVAEGLVQEKPGEIVEDTAKENIEKLVELGMIHVEELTCQGTKYEVLDEIRKPFLLKMEEENFLIVCASSDTNVPLTARRISIHSETKNVPSNLNILPIRSLFIFGIEGFPDSEFDRLRPAFHGVKFLRVLDLEDIRIRIIPDEIGDLIHLRYLGLNKSEVDELPETIYNLRNLQTLDLRWNGKLIVLSSALVNLVQLRHLKMFNNWGVGGVVVQGVGRLENLQTLTGVYVGGGVAADLGSLTQLRRLGVRNFTEDHANELYVSVKKMPGLLSLSLEPKDLDANLPSLEPLSPPPLLRKICLNGGLQRIPSWIVLMKSLIKLRLGFSNLSENPGSVLQSLPNLKHLTLWEAHNTKQMGREFCGVGGFPKLEVLVISSLVLEEWTELEEGAFPSLKYLHIHSGLKLRMLPEGLQHVTTLEKLAIYPLRDDHAERLSADGGVENYKIQHIPHVTFITTSRVEQIAESHPSKKQKIAESSSS